MRIMSKPWEMVSPSVCTSNFMVKPRSEPCFAPTRSFTATELRDEIVEHVIEHRGGLAEVMRLAEGIVPTISAEVIPEKKNMQKRKVKKSKSTKPKTAGKTKSK